MLSPKITAYIPQDRRQALATGRELPNQTYGAALWADLSGFTPLTEALARSLGARRGAEELAVQLNRFYDGLIAPVEAYGGSVVDFSGDAINAWFEADDGQRAVAAALAMQAAMRSFADMELPGGERVSVGVKIAVAAGSARRLLVGDPEVQLIDALAGAIMERLPSLGHLAQTGEILIDQNIVTQMGEQLQISERRENAALVKGLKTQPEPFSQSPFPDLSEEQIRPWLLPAVFSRLQSGQGEFLTELRPAVALFMRFDGPEYEADEHAEEKLDAFLRRVQTILTAYEGTLLQLTLGDKGNYLYAAFGAPLAHENDIERAISAAIEMLNLPDQLEGIHSASIGLSRGTMRTGAYGSATRRTYGVLGDEVNLAARLMQRAAPGQILASETIWRTTSDEFDWQEQPAFAAKGKSAPVKPAILIRHKEREMLHLSGVTAMIGRQTELTLIEEKLTLARQGKGQIIIISGEAGVGKSRLLAEALAHAGAITRYDGECQSYGAQSAYLVWHSIWRAFFSLDPSAPAAAQIERLEAALAAINPDFPLRLPLLGVALNLSIPDNGLTSNMDAKARKTSRESLLVDCVKVRASKQPFIFILEDLHWSDPLSRDLLELIARAIQDLPVLILVAHRPIVESAVFLPTLTKLEHMTAISLAELTRDETAELIAVRLAHFGLTGNPSTGSEKAPPALVERLYTRAQGNPFYTEELLNSLRDQGLDPRLETSWQQADLPDSLHRLILSRIDRLVERQQITIKTASVIGRLFKAAWLYGYYPALGGPASVTADLEALNRLDFTLLETPEPELTYLFKHVITQEAAYESLAYATRARLHEQFARYLELVAGEDVGPYLDMLAYHYERSENLPKKRGYLRKAGEAAAASFANDAALTYLEKALVLAPENDYAERFDILAAREKVLDILGRRDAQEQDLTTLAMLAEDLDDNKRRIQVAFARSYYALARSDHSSAIANLHQIVEWAYLAGAQEDEGHAYLLWGHTLMLDGNYVETRERYQQALALAKAAKLARLTAHILVEIGRLDLHTANYESAQTNFEDALHFQREAGNQMAETFVLAHLGDLAFFLGDFVQAQTYYEQVLRAFSLIGHRRSEGIALNKLCQAIIEQRGDYEKAKSYNEQALHIAQEIGDRLGELTALTLFSLTDLLQNNYQIAKVYAERSLQICQEIGKKDSQVLCLVQLGRIMDELSKYTSAVEHHKQGISILREIDERNFMSQTLTASGMVLYHLGQNATSLENSREALLVAEETKNKLGQNRALTLQGHIFREMGNLDKAADSYSQALNLALALDLQHYVVQAQTGLIAIAIAQGNTAKAMAPIDEILDYLATHVLSTIDEVAWIYLTCYRILQAADDPRALPTLEIAYKFIQDIAVRIDDEHLRVSFLQNVRFNREIIAARESRQQP